MFQAWIRASSVRLSVQGIVSRFFRKFNFSHRILNVCVFTGQFSAAPGFDVFVSLLVEVTDRSWRYLGSSKSFCDILHAADGYPGQIHFDQGFFDGAFPAFIAFDDGCLKLDTFQFRHLSFHLSCSGGEATQISMRSSFSTITINRWAKLSAKVLSTQAQ